MQPRRFWPASAGAGGDGPYNTESRMPRYPLAKTLRGDKGRRAQMQEVLRAWFGGGELNISLSSALQALARTAETVRNLKGDRGEAIQDLRPGTDFCQRNRAMFTSSDAIK
jgi:hypothetical protein